MSFLFKELLYAPVLMCGSMSFGTIIAFGSATRNMLEKKWKIKLILIQLFQAAPAFVSIFSSILWYNVLKKQRRKVCLSIIGIFGTVIWLCMLTMNKETFWPTIILRALLGIILSGCCIIVPLYISDIAPPGKKGLFSSLHVCGVVLSHVCINLLGVTNNWRAPIYFIAPVMFILGTCIWLIPDSPMDLPKIKAAEAKKLAKQQANKSENEDSMESNFYDTDQISSENVSEAKDPERPPINQNQPPPQITSLYDKRLLKKTITSGFLFFWMQCCGIGAVQENLRPLMMVLGLHIDGGYQAAIAVSAQFISAFLSSILIDRFGCKRLYIVSGTGTSLFIFLLALNCKFGWSKWLPMITIFCFQFFFGIGIGNVPYVFTTQAIPMNLRPRGMSIGASLLWTGAFIVMFLWGYIRDGIQHFGLFMVLTCTNLVALFFGIFFLDDIPKTVPNAGQKAGQSKEGRLSDLLHELDDKKCSCIIRNKDKKFSFSNRGVRDLYDVVKNKAEILKGADVADKIIGHGAAVLLVQGGAKNVITHIVSKSGLEFLKMNEVNVVYDDEVDHIMNRKKNDWCPLEKSLNNMSDVDDIMEIIGQNVNNTEDSD